MTTEWDWTFRLRQNRLTISFTSPPTTTTTTPHPCPQKQQHRTATTTQSSLTILFSSKINKWGHSFLTIISFQWLIKSIQYGQCHLYQKDCKFISNIFVSIAKKKKKKNTHWGKFFGWLNAALDISIFFVSRIMNSWTWLQESQTILADWNMVQHLRPLLKPFPWLEHTGIFKTLNQ